ncbi:MAG: YceI family protein [Rhodobacteraceae bacterium]|nr:YceI family protein [Paracoccaceae bacterium]
MPLVACPLWAAPRTYDLVAAQSQVAFEVDIGPDKITGTMPIKTAQLSLDFRDLSHCEVAVDLDAGHADAAPFWAKQAMLGPKVLSVAEFPTIRFQSTGVTGDVNGAKIAGDVTLRGVTRPLVMDGVIWRRLGSDANDLSRLTVKLTGVLHRSEFGATGWGDLVGDDVRLTILARIEAAP